MNKSFCFKFAILLCLTSLITPSQGQIRVIGKVLNGENKTPIPHVNIGIMNTTFGTISNSDGSFEIKITDTYLLDSLTFSAIGFRQRKIAVNHFNNNIEKLIILEENPIYLDEVVIRDSESGIKYKRQIFGNKKRPLLPQGQMNIDSISAGGAMAILIEKKEYSTLNFLESAELFITKNTVPEFKVRVRILKVDSANKNLPGDDLINESIVVKSRITRGWLNFDLAPYNFKIEEKAFYLVFEWILEEQDRRNIFHEISQYGILNPEKVLRDSVIIDGEKVESIQYSSTAEIPIIAFGDTRSKSDFKKHKCYSRSNSFGIWERSTGIVSGKIYMANLPNYELRDDSISSKIEKPLSLEGKINAWGNDFVQNYSIVGMQLAVSSKNESIFSDGFGFSDIENQEEVGRNTRFRIASVSKPITALAIMKLASEQKINLDSSIYTYVPTFPKKKYDLTIRQLLGHLAGIRDYYELSIDEIYENPHFESATKALAVFERDSLMFRSGAEFLYSSFGYVLLGAVIEGASGLSYLDYMQENIWTPLDMKNTYADVFDSVQKNKSSFYSINEEKEAPYDLSYGHPGGGLISTCDDLILFGKTMYNETFIPTEIKIEMFKSQNTSNGFPTNYGLGWYLDEDNSGRKIWYHMGELPSSGSGLIIYPEEEIVISLLTNSPIISNAKNGLVEEIQQLAEMVIEN